MQQCKKCWAAARSVAANAHCTLNSFDRNHTSFASLNFRTMQVINYHLFGAASSHFHVPVFASNGSPLQTNRHEIRIRKLMHRHNSSLPLDGTSIITIENKFWRGISNGPAQKINLNICCNNISGECALVDEWRFRWLKLENEYYNLSYWIRKMIWSVRVVPYLATKLCRKPTSTTNARWNYETCGKRENEFPPPAPASYINISTHMNECMTA